MPALLLAIAGIGVSCSSEKDVVDPDIVISGDPNAVISGEPRAVNMVYPEKVVNLTSEQRAYIVANNAFSLNLFREISENDGNKSSFCSPLSVTYLLSMLNAGAEGNTQKEIQDVLGFGTSNPTEINAFCENLLKTAPELDPKVTLSIANSIFVNNAIGKILPSYQQEMEKYYEAKVEDMDFENVRNVDKINNWCNQQTNGMIPKILEDNEFDPNVVMFLLNAIYFKADWTEKFEEKYTQKADFIGASDTKKVNMMHQKVLANYGESDEYTSLSLPYGDGAFCMKIFLPKEGKSINDVLGRLKYEMSPDKMSVEGYEKNDVCEVDVKIPRWETSTNMPLIKILKKMGIQQMFNPFFAELTKMAKGTSLYVGIMKQLAKIEVNETGSKAAAVTIGGTYELVSNIPSVPREPRKVDFHANRPFLYMITERGSNAVFFMGKYMGE